MLKEDELRQFGLNMYEMRKAQHMTQMQLAEVMDVDNRMISRYETGQAEPGAMYYDRLLEVCGQKPQGESAHLLQLFAGLTPENKVQLLTLAEMMCKAQKYKSNNTQQTY